MAWDDEDIARAFALRYLSKRAYAYLRELRNIPFPHIVTLQHYASKLDFNPGLLKDVLRIMKANGMHMPIIEKLVVLTFDEVKVRSILEYDVKNDQIMGEHSQLQVIMVRDLFSSWKQPIYLAFDEKMIASILYNAERGDKP